MRAGVKKIVLLLLGWGFMVLGTIGLFLPILLNSVALFLSPAIGYALHLTQAQFGLWSALAIHDTSSVVGATAMIFGTSDSMLTTSCHTIRDKSHGHTSLVPVKLPLRSQSGADHRKHHLELRDRHHRVRLFGGQQYDLARFQRDRFAGYGHLSISLDPLH